MTIPREAGISRRELLERGEVLNRGVPREQDDGVVWSGMRLGERAVVRALKQGSGKGKLAVRPWSQRELELETDGEGHTYILREDGKVERPAPP